METSIDYTIRDYRPEDEGKALALIQHGMGGGPTGEREVTFWRWKHFDNPFGRSIGLVAATGTGQIIGLRTFMRWRFAAGDRPVSAVRAVDTVTHPDYRRYGVFSALTRQALERVKNDGVDLIFNTPNNQVLPGYLKLGWSYVAMIRPLIKVLNYPRFAAGMLRNRARSASGQLPLEGFFRDRPVSVADFMESQRPIGELLDSYGRFKNGRLLTRRTPDYLKWRYCQYPGVNYGIVQQERKGTPAGCAIFRSSTRFGLKEAVLAELILSGPDEGTASSLLKEMKRSVRADYLIAYFPEGSFERRMLLKNGFHRVPRGGQNFAVNMLNPGLPCDPRKLESWDISLGDLEMF